MKPEETNDEMESNAESDDQNDLISNGLCNIQTFLRIKPSRCPSNHINLDDSNPTILRFHIPSDLANDYINNSKTDYDFQFNGIMDMKCSQDQVFEKLGRPAVLSVLDGYNSTIFAYGQTGSGKTYTITGGPDKYSDRGIIPRSIGMMFSEFQRRTDMQFQVYVSYLEVYNEHGYDLLDTQHESRALEEMNRVTLMEDENGNIHLRNLSMHLINTEEDALNLLFVGDTNRAVAETPMNQASTRSHCIFTMSIEAREGNNDDDNNLPSSKIRRSKLHLVDLAGSERVRKTMTDGQTLREAKYINTSLFYLEMVIVSLYEKSRNKKKNKHIHIPYRNSLMTSVLRDSIGGNCITIMLATINPELDHVDESISTCRFSQRVAMIKNVATVNESVDPSLVIKKLKHENDKLKQENDFLKKDNKDDNTDDKEVQRRIVKFDLNQLIDSCKEFVKSKMNRRHGTFWKAWSMNGNDNDDIDDISECLFRQQLRPEPMSLSRIQLSFNILANMIISNDDNHLMSPVSRQKSDAKQELDRPVVAAVVADDKNVDDENDDKKSSSKSDEKITKPIQVIPVPAFIQILHGVRLPLIVPDAVNNNSAADDGVIEESLFRDMQTAFEYFKSKSPCNDSIESNKSELKAKYDDAKMYGEAASSGKNRLQYLKETIESLRKERAIESINNKCEDEDTGEEIKYLREMDEEKLKYKESCAQLRILKQEVDQIQALLQRSRLKLHQQFEEWYKATSASQELIRASRQVKAEEKVASIAATNDKNTNDDIAAFYKARDELKAKRKI